MHARPHTDLKVCYTGVWSEVMSRCTGVWSEVMSGCTGVWSEVMSPGGREVAPSGREREDAGPGLPYSFL